MSIKQTFWPEALTDPVQGISHVISPLELPAGTILSSYESDDAAESRSLSKAVTSLTVSQVSLSSWVEPFAKRLRPAGTWAYFSSCGNRRQFPDVFWVGLSAI